jgi:gluconolactonase
MQHGDRRLVKMAASLANPREKYLPLADNYQGKKLNSPNDGIIDKQGNIYFTDPPYGLPENMNDQNKELPFQGVYCLLKNGALILLDTLSYPNGIGLSPDGTKLYVAVSDPQHAVWYQYTIESPGKTSGKKIFYDATSLVDKHGYQGLPDGLAVNAKGYIFATGPGGVWIFNSEAKPLARVLTGQLTSNCALGKNEKQLFMTADDYILSLTLK